MKDEIIRQLKESSKVKLDVIALANEIELASSEIYDTLKNNGKLILFGNGGSAAQAQHIAAEFVNKFKRDRNPLSAMSLTTDTSILTSVGNDSSFDDIFKKQIEAHCNKNDVVIAITTSDVSLDDHGHSRNISKGIEASKTCGAKVIGLLSEKSHRAGKMVDIPIKVPSSDTARIQEAHITILHIICDLVEQKICR